MRSDSYPDFAGPTLRYALDRTRREESAEQFIQTANKIVGEAFGGSWIREELHEGDEFIGGVFEEWVWYVNIRTGVIQYQENRIVPGTGVGTDREVQMRYSEKKVFRRAERR